MKINIEYDVTTSFVLTVERDELPEDHDALLNSITRDELATAPCNVWEIGWSHLKESWRSATPDNTTVTDENENQLFTD